VRRLDRRRGFTPRTHAGGWTFGLIAGVAAAAWLGGAAHDGTLASHFDTLKTAWLTAAGIALVLLVGSQAWPRFFGAFGPMIGLGTVLAGSLDQSPGNGVHLLLPLIAVGVMAVLATFNAITWERDLYRGRRS
jgi:hypothetical protein